MFKPDLPPKGDVIAKIGCRNSGLEFPRRFQKSNGFCSPL